MKWKAYALAAVVSAVFASCGTNSADKETTTTEDTATNTVTDQTVTATTVNVPANTKTVFETKYPSASNVRWDRYRPDMSTVEWDWTGWPAMDTADYTARFNWDGTDYMAWYDDQGNWVGTVNVISDPTTLPTAVNSTIQSQYNGYTITSVSKENDKNRTAYEVSLDKAGDKMKVLIDENGKVLKKKTVTADTKSKEKTNPKDSM
jgi:hypothetical protein